MKKLFFSLADSNNVLPFIEDKTLLKKFSKNFQKTFEEYFSQPEILQEFAFFILNREPMDVGHYLRKGFWNRNRLSFLELLNDNSVKKLHESVQEAEKLVLDKTEALLNLIKFERKMLSEKHGVPFYG